MMVTVFDAEFEIPDLLVDKFTRDFDSLPGSGKYEEINMLRDSVNSVLEIVAEDPEMLHEPELLHDFIHALAVRQALSRHGILYDA